MRGAVFIGEARHSDGRGTIQRWRRCCDAAAAMPASATRHPWQRASPCSGGGVYAHARSHTGLAAASERHAPHRTPPPRTKSMCVATSPPTVDDRRTGRILNRCERRRRGKKIVRTSSPLRSGLVSASVRRPVADRGRLFCGEFYRRSGECAIFRRRPFCVDAAPQHRHTTDFRRSISANSSKERRRGWSACVEGLSERWTEGVLADSVFAFRWHDGRKIDLSRAARRRDNAIVCCCAIGVGRPT